MIRESALAVSFGIDVQCTVDGGQWFAPFTGKTVSFSRLLDIDHTVPLANAHRSGAWAWSSQNKEDYFNDLSFDGHLIAVALTVSRSRGTSGPEDWQPPNMGSWCEYAVNWIQVKAAWNLTATADEWSALEKMLGTCSADLAIEIGEPVTVAETPAGSALPTPTPTQSPTLTPTPTPLPTPEPTPTPFVTPTPAPVPGLLQTGTAADAHANGITGPYCHTGPDANTDSRAGPHANPNDQTGGGSSSCPSGRRPCGSQFAWNRPFRG